jgi:hypothetical protein
MASALVIIGLFFVIGIVFGAVLVVALSILRRDVGPPDGPGGPHDYGPPGPSGPPPDLGWDDTQDQEPGGNSHSQFYGR